MISTTSDGAAARAADVGGIPVKKTFHGLAATGACLSLVISVTIALPARAEPLPDAAAPSPTVVWSPCADLPGLDCAKIDVPLDYARPSGPTIKIAITRRAATVPPQGYRGVLLFNPGGPGGSGRDYPEVMPARLGDALASSYDLIGFDPRGVGQSEPRLSCDPQYFDPVRPDYLAASPGAVRAWQARADGYAAACRRAFGSMLPYMGTVNSARDMDMIRRALGATKISYVGYSYGTYLGATYATLFPDHVHRMVLDSVVRPSGVWYQDILRQDAGFERRAHDFFAWIAAYDPVYGLGTTAEEVEHAYYATRAAVGAEPAGGVVGPAEFDDTFLAGGYLKARWPRLADALAEYVAGDVAPLVDAYHTFGDQSGDDNGYAVYLAVECADAAWPRDDAHWYRDAWASQADAPFLTWGNTWYNMPCRSWPRAGARGAPVDVRARKGLPDILLFQDTDDAATPYEGAVEMQDRFPGSRLVVMEGGGDHGLTGRGDPCVDGYWKAYLTDGSLPAARPGPDAYCPPTPDPVPPGATPRPEPVGVGLPS
jgi:pimeloyl-ACP methyl ester carboxylesterase